MAWAKIALFFKPKCKRISEATDEEIRKRLKKIRRTESFPPPNYLFQKVLIICGVFVSCYGEIFGLLSHFSSAFGLIIGGMFFVAGGIWLINYETRLYYRTLQRIAQIRREAKRHWTP